MLYYRKLLVLHHMFPYYLPYFIKWYTHHTTYCCKVHTVNRKIFAVKNFCQLLRWWKLNALKFFYGESLEYVHTSRGKLNAWTFLTQKKATWKFSRSTVFHFPVDIKGCVVDSFHFQYTTICVYSSRMHCGHEWSWRKQLLFTQNMY